MSKQMTTMIMGEVKTILSQPENLSAKMIGTPFNGVYQEYGDEISRNGKTEFKKLVQCDKTGKTLCYIIEINGNSYICTLEQWNTITDLVAPIKFRNNQMAKSIKNLEK